MHGLSEYDWEKQNNADKAAIDFIQARKLKEKVDHGVEPIYLNCIYIELLKIIEELNDHFAVRREQGVSTIPSAGSMRGKGL